MGDIRNIDDETPTPYAPREAGRRVYDEIGREIREQRNRARGAVNEAGDLYDQATGGGRSSTRRSTARSLPTTGRSGSEPVRDDSGISGEHAGETVGRKRYSARAKYMEYLDDVANMRRIEQRGDRSENTIVFKKREDKLAYSSASADVLQYQQDNANCDAGDRGACNRAGRGDAPTEYASPFRGSDHFSDFAYFGAGGVSRATPAENTSVVAPPPPEPEPVAPTAPPVEPEPEPEPAPTPMLPPPSKEEPANIPTAVDGSGKEHLPEHNQDHRDPISGGGTNTGSKSGANHGADGFEPLPQPNTTGVNEYKRNRKQYDFIETTNVFNFRPCD